MGDAGEGLIDADSRIQERMEELARERAAQKSPEAGPDPVVARALESLRLARVDLERQLKETSHEGRRKVITQAIGEIDRRIAETKGKKK